MATFVLLFGVPAAPSYLLAAHIEPMILSIAITYGLFYIVVVSSIVLYRVSPMHPLAKYPGPLLLKISKFIGMCYASDGKQYLYFKSLHDKYGSFVRVGQFIPAISHRSKTLTTELGPNEISVSDAEAVPHILNSDGMRKGPREWQACSDIRIY